MKLDSAWRGAALLTGSLLLPLAAAATIPAETLVSNTVTVKYRPSLASTSSGAKRLYGSLRSAAVSACRDPGSPAFVIDAAYRACASGALDQAVEKVNIPAISELHSQNHKR